jgi:hypothetical protein
MRVIEEYGIIKNELDKYLIDDLNDIIFDYHMNILIDELKEHKDIFDEIKFNSDINLEYINVYNIKKLYYHQFLDHFKIQRLILVYQMKNKKYFYLNYLFDPIDENILRCEYLIENNLLELYNKI